MTETPLEKPMRMYNAEGRVAIVTHTYEGDPPREPHGYYYHYEDDPKVRHWISHGAISIRFSKEPPARVPKTDRRTATIAAATMGIQNVHEALGAVSVVPTDKGFCVVFGNDDRMYFDIVEM